MAIHDPTIDALLNSFYPSGTALLDWLKPHIDDSILQEISYADYGRRVNAHYGILVAIRDEQKIPSPLEWCPRETLELMRWSEPEDPEWGPGSTGERGHWIRIFSCAVLLKAADDPDSMKILDSENDTLIQFVASALWLGPEAIHHALQFLSWRILRMMDDDEYPFFAMAILLLRAAEFAPGSDSEELRQLADWIVIEEELVRGKLNWGCASVEWLLGLMNFDQRHNRWREVTSAVLLDPAKNIPEPAASALREIAERIAPRSS
ncbi:MAG: hypothetical protein ABIY70_09970 [Capsulimonas sp.]|uniref:hypothetical protein n=1 Tax=Capsulimonas sp. TaxID=2494211 RepID=UPI003266D7B1